MSQHDVFVDALEQSVIAERSQKLGLQREPFAACSATGYVSCGDSDNRCMVARAFSTPGGLAQPKQRAVCKLIAGRRILSVLFWGRPAVWDRWEGAQQTDRRRHIQRGIAIHDPIGNCDYALSRREMVVDQSTSRAGVAWAIASASGALPSVRSEALAGR